MNTETKKALLITCAWLSGCTIFYCSILFELHYDLLSRCLKKTKKLCYSKHHNPSVSPEHIEFNNNPYINEIIV